MYVLLGTQRNNACFKKGKESCVNNYVRFILTINGNAFLSLIVYGKSVRKCDKINVEGWKSSILINEHISMAILKMIARTISIRVPMNMSNILCVYIYTYIYMW